MPKLDCSYLCYNPDCCWDSQTFDISESDANRLLDCYDEDELVSILLEIEAKQGIDTSVHYIISDDESLYVWSLRYAVDNIEIFDGEFTAKEDRELM